MKPYARTPRPMERALPSYRTGADAQRPTTRLFIMQSAGALILLAVLVGAGIAVEHAARGFIPPQETLGQENYDSLDGIPPGVAARLRFFADLGRDSRLIAPRKNDSRIRLELRNFNPASPWGQRAVAWHADAAPWGEILVAAPPGEISAVALYLSDGDSHWRASRLFSGGDDYLAERLHNGKWILIPLTEEERQRGEKHIRIEQLTGATIAVSGIAIFE